MVCIFRWKDPFPLFARGSRFPAKREGKGGTDERGNSEKHKDRGRGREGGFIAERTNAGEAREVMTTTVKDNYVEVERYRRTFHATKRDERRRKEPSEIKGQRKREARVNREETGGAGMGEKKRSKRRRTVENGWKKGKEKMRSESRERE